MPRIKLAYWHDGHSPGDEVDVTDEEFAALRRDGRVAETVQEPPAQVQAPAQPEPQPQAEAAADQPEGRKRR